MSPSRSRTRSKPESGKPKVIILGGGVGAMAAAFELTNDENWRSHFESITVYQVGWRLGGKGASGRGPAPAFPVQEHGLHVWFGFYENAFRMMRECYGALGRPPGDPVASVEDAFQPARTFLVQERRPEGWVQWEQKFHDNNRSPGRKDDADEFTLLSGLKQALHLAALLLSAAVPAERGPETRSSLRAAATTDDGFELVTRPAHGSALDAVTRELGAAWRRVEPDVRQLAHAALAAALELVDEVDEEAAEAQGVLADHVEQAVDAAKRYLRERVQRSDDARRDWYVADILLACVRGALRHGVVIEGLDVIDEFEFTDWLILNGADEESARSAIVRTIIYDLPFAYRDGRPDQPECSAATALGGLIRLFFTYKGSIAWKMNSGMGDVVFAPMYEVLRNRGVIFEFFHRVEKLHLSPDGKRIGSIDLTRQVELAPSAKGTYDPLIDVPHGSATGPLDHAVSELPVHLLRCWPAAPKTELLVGGQDLTLQGAGLERSVADLSNTTADAPGTPVHLDVTNDHVVLGISLGALDSVCSELVDHDPRWQEMVTHLKTVQTQSFQLWLSEPMSTLLNSERLGNSSATLGGYLEPFDTYADMSHLVDTEGQVKTRSIAYFTNVLPTFTGSAEEALQTVKANALRFLRDEMVPLWPGAVERYPTDFRWDLLVVPDEAEDAEGVERFDHQFFKANTDPSDGYVLSLPGTMKYRLDPGDSGFTNLFLAGDWTYCDLNAGCVEAAVISGLLVACRINKKAPVDRIVGHRFHRPPGRES